MGKSIARATDLCTNEWIGEAWTFTYETIERQMDGDWFRPIRKIIQSGEFFTFLYDFQVS